jgi:hypothetical protein
MGGQDIDETFSDTWTWDGSQWTQLDVEGPKPRGFQAMTYDADKERVLLYGGRQEDHLFQDLWSWDGRRWELLTNDGPLRRGVYASAYDRTRRTLVIHGSGDFLDGKWELQATTWAWSDDTGWRVVAGSDVQ